MTPAKTTKTMALFLVSILVFGNFISASAQASTIKKIVTKKAGRIATPGINTLLSGAGAPKSTIGIDGDIYIDTKNTNMHGPKTLGKWPAGISLKGAAGTNGTNGINGSTGASGAAGAKGAPSSGTEGVSGSPGPAGPAGPAGATGTTGPAGSGAAGANGTPGINGSPGSNGSNGTAGSVGATGATGSKGETGTAGSIPATMGLLTFTTMIGTSSSSSIKDFGNFTLGKNYVVQLLLHGVAQDGATKLIKLAVASPDPLVVLTVDYVVLNGYTSRSGSPEQESSIIATILVNGSSTIANYYLTTTITCNESSVSPGLRFTGAFSSIQVA